jgi:branched-chain amino acid transport system substrate-binding protein
MGVDMAHPRSVFQTVLLFAFAIGATPSPAQREYDPGVSDTEIKIGNIRPRGGSLSAYALNGRTEAAYFRKLNDEGGINGRKIKFISHDDGFSPSKTVEQARKLVESDDVLLISQSLGTPTNSAIQRYMNQKKVAQLFVAIGATKFGEPAKLPLDHGNPSSVKKVNIVRPR